MTTPRLRLITHLGLATAHAGCTTPGWIEDCEREVLRAWSDLQELKDPNRVNSIDAAFRALLKAPVDVPGREA